MIYDRFIFFMRNQEGETIDQYFNELKTLAKDCGFGDLKDSLISCRIVCGNQSDAVRERLLRDPDLDVNRAIDICTASAVSKCQVAEMSKSHVKRSRSMN